MATFERGGFPLLYLSATDPVPEDLRTRRHGGYEFRYDAVSARHPRMRRAFVLPPGRSFFGALHWADGTDLDLLDTLAERGADVGEAADRAVFGMFASPICFACDTSRLVLGVDRGLGPLTPAQTTRRLSTSCPTCGDDGFLAHLEVLDD